MNAAEESAEEIFEHLDGAHMVFITAGMGGGTGTGAAPVIAKCARDRGILTVGVVTKPFTFEGRHRMRLADAGIAELQRYVDTLIVIPNQNLFRVANERTTFADAFGMADQVLHSGVRSITDLMILPGLINLDFADVRAVMSEMGKAMMGTGEASGDDRALQAAQNAIANPLLDEAIISKIEPQGTNLLDGRRNAAPAAPAAPARAPEPARAEAPRAAEAAPVTPTFQPTERSYAAAPRADVRPEPVIHVAEDRDLQPIVDPWVEEYEAAPRPRTAAAAPASQGDLYSERPAPAAPAREEAVAEDSYDDRDHRRSGWSLFGRGKRTATPPVYVPSSPSRGTSQMRTTTSAQPAPEPETGQAEDDLEIPSFLRRLAN